MIGRWLAFGALVLIVGYGFVSYIAWLIARAT